MALGNPTLNAAGKFGDLKKRLLFVLAALVVFRIGTFILVPGIDPLALDSLFKSQSMVRFPRLSRI